MHIKQSKEWRAIVETTCKEFQADEATVISKYRGVPYVLARQVIMFLLYNHILKNVSALSRAFGVTRQTIVYTRRAVGDYMSYDGWLKKKIEAITDTLKKDKII